jgi:16S rRNA (adenine1518-N6/adenine1519-N6)-dimethyltransferase
MDAIEIDRDLVIELSRLSAPLGTLLLHSADALRFDFRALMQEERRLRIIGNLPYNISTPLLFHLLEKIDVIQDMHFMLQKEVVERMVAMPGDDAYGRLSVMLQYYCEAQALFTVGAHAFKPAPKVASAVIRLKPHRTLPHVCKDVKILAQVVKLAFGQRRKTIRNSLKTWVTPTELLTLEIDPQIRPERLGVKDFVRIANFKTFLSS